MTNFELKEKIDNYTAEYEKIVAKSINKFILNPKLTQLANKIYDLQKQCNHKFENGKCIYCGMEE